METSFFSPTDFKNFFSKEQMRNELISEKEIAIGSIADLLHTCEDQKKGNINLTNEEFDQKFELFANYKGGPVQRGIVYISDLSEEKLSASLFDKTDGVITALWEKAANKEISPRRSIRYLTLRICDETAWWSDQVCQEMEEYHSSRDS